MENFCLENTSRILIRRAQLVDPRSKWNDQVVDLLIEDGQITTIEKGLKRDCDLEINAEGMLITPGWHDLRAFVREPGAEHQETVISALNAAAFGGFTSILAHPSTESPIQKAADVQYLLSKASGHPVSLNICAAVSSDLEGKELAELYDMHLSGAIAFGNGNHAYEQSGLLQRALLYTTGWNTMIFSHAIDRSLEHGGVVNESESTVHSGLRLSPALAEFTSIQKEIEIARYCDQPLHFSHISSAQSVALIRQAKKDGLKISCDVSIMHLCFTDDSVLAYDSQFKLNPPLRTERDRKALIEGVNDGTINAVVSDHQPLNIERKKVEFDFAGYGVINLQTVYSLYLKYLQEEIPFDVWTEALSIRPAEILGQKKAVLQEGERADLTLFDPAAKWTLNKSTNQSLSENHPFFNMELRGQAALISNHGITALLQHTSNGT